jgi:hypothetical protein
MILILGLVRPSVSNQPDHSIARIVGSQKGAEDDLQCRQLIRSGYVLPGSALTGKDNKSSFLSIESLFDLDCWICPGGAPAEIIK